MKSKRILIFLCAALAGFAGQVKPVYAADGKGTEHVILVTSGNHVDEAWFDGAWHANDLTELSRVNVEPSSKPGLTGFALSEEEFVYYVGSDEHIYLVYYEWNTSKWYYEDVTTLSRAPLATYGSPLVSILNGQQGHVYYVATDMHVHEIYWKTGGVWLTDDLNASAGSPTAATASALTAIAMGSEELVYYLTSNGHVQELYSTNDGSSWLTEDTTVSSGAPDAAVGSALTSLDWNLSTYVYFYTGDGHIHQLTSTNGSKWVTLDVIAAASAPASANLASLTGLELQGVPTIYYLTADGHVHELTSQNSGASWSVDDPTALSGAGNAVSWSPLSCYTWENGAGYTKRVYFFTAVAVYLYQMYTVGQKWDYGVPGGSAGIPSPLTSFTW